MRKSHRWLGLPAAFFLLLAAITGVSLECVRFFGEEEAERERIRDMTSTATAQSIGAEFATSFDKARAAAAEKAGAQPLDKVVWQLKGDAPTVAFFFGPKDKQEGQRIIVNAKSGAVVKVEGYAEDSLLLRIHSGEAFGDGGMVLGMFWGLSLIVLTVTGLIIYFRMKPRTPQNGLRKIFWALTAFASVTATRADSPFFTDDPAFSPGWEIKLGITAEHNNGGDALAGPVLDLNYAIVPNVRLNATFYYAGLYPKAGADVFGFGNTEFKVKWRFIEEDAKSWLPAVSISPKVFFPTASTDRGLGDGIWRAQLPIELGKTVGNWYHFAETGYQWAFENAASDTFFWGAGTLYNFNKHFALGTELYGLIPTDAQHAHTFAATLGAIYTFNANWSLKASISHSLRDDEQPGPRPAGVFYVVWNF